MFTEYDVIIYGELDYYDSENRDNKVKMETLSTAIHVSVSELYALMFNT